MAKAISMTTGIPGLEVWINYHANNLRIQSVEWAIPTGGIAARARIWDSGTLVFDRTVAGPANGSESVPSGYSMVQVTDSSGTYISLPPNITYQFNVESG